MKSGILKGLSYGAVLSAGHAFTATILLTYYASGHELTVAKVFRTMLFCSMLLDVSMARVTMAVQQVGQLFKSLERIEVLNVTLQRLNKYLKWTVSNQIKRIPIRVL